MWKTHVTSKLKPLTRKDTVEVTWKQIFGRPFKMCVSNVSKLRSCSIEWLKWLVSKLGYVPEPCSKTIPSTKPLLKISSRSSFKNACFLCLSFVLDAWFQGKWWEILSYQILPQQFSPQVLGKGCATCIEKTPKNARKVLHHLQCKKTLKIMGSTTYQYHLVSHISWIKHMSYLLHLGSLRENRSGKSIGIPAVCWLIWGGIWVNYNKIPKPACFGRHFGGRNIPDTTHPSIFSDFQGVSFPDSI